MVETRNRSITYASERLAYWYFRLNGFLTIENFILHHEETAAQQTDADVIAVRLLHRSENHVRPMDDDPLVCQCDTLINVVLAEVKTDEQNQNKTWTKSEKGNVQRALRAVGCVDASEVDEVAEQVYRFWRWDSDVVTIRVFVIGDRPGRARVPKNQLVDWDHIIEFVITRFRDYGETKRNLAQWSEDGKQLARIAGDYNIDDLEKTLRIRRLFRLNV